MSNLELKGFKALRELGTLLEENASQKLDVASFRYLPVDDLQPGKYQPRVLINQDELEELAASIKAQGIIQPLIVRKIDNNTQYEIIAGERRWRAAKIAGLPTVPVMVRNIQDSTALAFSVVENIQREDLNPIEEALSFLRLQSEFNMTHADIAKIIGRSRASVTNTMRLVNLADPVKELLSVGKISMGHARTLLTTPLEQQLGLAEKMIAENLNVRKSEELANVNKSLKKKDGKHYYKKEVDSWIKRLSEYFFSKITVHINEKGDGKLTIYFESPQEIEWIVEQLDKKNKPRK